MAPLSARELPLAAAYSTPLLSHGVETAELNACSTLRVKLPPMPTPSQPLPSYFPTAAQDWAVAHPWWSTLIGGTALVLLGWLAFRLTREVLIVALNRLGARVRAKWDDALQKRRFFHRLAYLVPLIIYRAGLPYLPAFGAGIQNLLDRLLVTGMIIVIARAISAFVTAFGDLHAQTPNAHLRPIKGYLQVVIIIAYLLAAITVIATLLDQNPAVILSGVGAASAVLLLIFRDTILGLVAGVQLTSNDLIRVGDWIEMPQFNADGDVIDIALNNVTVKNFDETFTVIPAHHFLDHSFRNWRGMQDSGGRRMKRSLLIDISSVHFLTPEDIEDLKRFALLRPYFEEKREDIDTWIAANPAARENPVNSRRLTNIGTFREYVMRYLRARPDIARNLTFMVRLMGPGPQGVPIEIYVFVADTRWTVYEGVQGDIFDHLMAILPEFGLRIFQNPSGADVRSLEPVIEQLNASGAPGQDDPEQDDADSG